MMQAMMELVLSVTVLTNSFTAVIIRSLGLSQALMAGVAVLNRFQSNLQIIKVMLTKPNTP